MASHLSIRARREHLGLSQTEVANRLGISKSYLSLAEANKRSLPEEQAKRLAEILAVPAELLLLESGRLPSDVRAAIETNAADVTTAVRIHAEQSAISYPEQPTTAPSTRGSISANRHTDSHLPLAITDTKATTSYRAHSYHTKVPPSAIVPFIEAYSQPGDWVADPFCGSGMTGVAALSSQRHALLSDLSPAAVHIASNYTSPCDPVAFREAVRAIEAKVRPTMQWLYRLPGDQRTIEYTTWSDVFECGRCAKPIVYWDALDNTETDRISCPSCRATLRKAELRWVEEVPVQTHTSAGSNRISTHDPTDLERALIREASETPIPYWIPDTRFGQDREMWRASHGAMGINNVSDFYTRRNLHALAALRHAIVQVSSSRLRRALLFAFTACVNRASKRYQWNAKRPTNVMTGTLYISSLRYEWNVWSLFKRKAADVLRYYSAFGKPSTEVQVFQRSATDLRCIQAASVDMVFMDPPFGSNIFYADSSLLWDAWLGTFTDPSGEIVVNRHRSRAAGGKTVEDYCNLMSEAFSEVSRILRHGARAVLAFSNSDDEVWEAVQDAVASSGLDVRGVHILDKGQPSIKGVKAQLGKEQVTRLDLLLSLAHGQRRVSGTRTATSRDFVASSIEQALAAGACRLDHIYSLVLRDALQAGTSPIGITMRTVEAHLKKIATIDAKGTWQRPRDAEDKGRDFVESYLADRHSLPLAQRSKEPSQPLSKRSIAGGRSSSLYLAHSYHTKVPPEAIRPFIEHFTRPGDVILDPFCGSGMTGVAAAMTGRHGILNDLSPAAIHLAWNHTRPCSSTDLEATFISIEEQIGSQLRKLYATTDERGEPAQIRWTIWSTRHRCPSCGKEFLLWDTIDKETGRLGRETKCPKCQSMSDRRRFTVVGNEPAFISFERSDGTRGTKRAVAADIQHAFSVRREDIELWYPTVDLGPDREMYQRCALHLQGIRSVADMYTNRNLAALALLWDAIGKVKEDRLRLALAFAFTNTAWHGTRMRRFNARGGHRPLTGTLYVPQLSSEANVLPVMRKKIGQVCRYYTEFKPKIDKPPAVIVGSAGKLDGVADNSVDYVFTDPPFGSNIFYADCNLIWEAWLGRLTNITEEAVVNRSLTQAAGGKSLSRYAELMSEAMREISRVLKPGGWATVVFHNTDSAVWSALHNAAAEAGFEFHEAASLDRKQQSHKGYKGRNGKENVAHFDVVLNLRKPITGRLARRRQAVAVDLVELMDAATRNKAVTANGLQGIHAEIMRQLMSRGSDWFPDFAEVRRLWEARGSNTG